MKTVFPISKIVTMIPIRLSAILLTMGAGLLGGSQASAAIIALDDFSYSDAALAGNGTAADGWNEAWRNTNGAGALVTSGVVTISSGGRTVRNLDLTSIATSLGHTLGADGTSVFIGIDHTIGARFSAVEFHNEGDTDAKRNFFFGKNNGTGGLYTTDATAASVTSSSTAAARYVIAITYGALNADTAELFRDGISQGTTVTASDLSFDRVAFGAFINNTLLATDNLIIATTFAEAAAVPEPSSVALLGLGGLALILRRRK
jgi:hypothetical protein